jgi:transposase
VLAVRTGNPRCAGGRAGPHNGHSVNLTRRKLANRSYRHITRFDRVQEFASYARLVKCAHISAGKVHGSGGAKMGNVHLKWAFSEAAVLFLRHAPRGKKLLAEIEKTHGKGKALSILAHKIGRAVFYMLSRGTVFSMEKFRAA